MIDIRQASARGRADFGWLDSRHTFSFGSYFDPQQMGYRALRVINEDRVALGGGFPTHPHRDMEIFSYVVEGELEHRDSMGHGSVIRAGEVQLMSAGTGVTHSEFNASDSEPLHFLQIWIVPERRGLKPDYQQHAFDVQQTPGLLHLIAAPDGVEGALTIRQDARLYAGALKAGQRIEQALPAERHAWLQVVRGELTANGYELVAGDGAALSAERSLAVVAKTAAELILFDLA
jgi:redox-sensitive bicupin YhaK (pirin superfamily)